MPVSKKFQITSYSTSRRKAPPSAKSLIKGQYMPNPYNAMIMCYGVEGYTLNLYFIPSEYDVPANQTDWDKKKGFIFLPAADYLPTIDLLRNEKPIFCRIYKDLPKINTIFTGKEVVGEEEGV